jgi:centromere protein J
LSYENEDLRETIDQINEEYGNNSDQEGVYVNSEEEGEEEEGEGRKDNGEEDGAKENSIEDQKAMQRIKEAKIFGFENLDWNMTYPAKYHNENGKVVEERKGSDNKLYRVYASGKNEVIFSNGVKKEYYPDGYSVVYFANEDVK